MKGMRKRPWPEAESCSGAIRILAIWGSGPRVYILAAFAGAFGGVYFANWDLGGSGGFEGGDGDDGGVFGIDAGWYQSEQLRFGVEGTAGTAELYGGDASIQWQPFDSTSNWVIGVYGGGGSLDGSGFYSAGIGVLYHFAAPKSLKRQLREDRL